MAEKTAFSARVSTTRPANATPYSANDVLGATAAVWKFATMGNPGGRIGITGTRLEIDVTAVPSGMTSFKLAMWNINPPSALADNAAFDLAAGDRPGFQGFIDLGTPVGLGSTLFVQQDQLWIPMRLAAGCTDLYGYLVTAGGFTPAGNSEVYVATLHSLAA